MSWRIIPGDVREVLRTLPEASVHCVVTSPPYFGLRDYGAPGQIGLEPTPDAYVETMVEVFRDVRRVLRYDGTLWLNLGDSYANDGKWGGHTGGKHAAALHASPIGRNKRYTGLKPKDLIGIPWRVAFALQADGWYLRADVIWSKPNPMPESVTDRPTKAHEYVFLLSKSAKYYYDADAIREPHATGERTGVRRSYPAGSASSMNDGEHQAMRGPFTGLPLNPAGRNRRSVWTITTQPYPEAHFATFPEELPEICIKAGTSEHGACSICGAPYERVVEKGAPLAQQRKASGADANGEYHGQAVKPYEGTGAQNASDVKRRILEGMVEKRTVGWKPTCACEGATVVPCTVLDPFCGAGTTGLVADRLGRDFIGIELNQAYAEMARQRIGGVTPLFNEEASA